MAIFLAACVVSQLPFLFLFLWLRKKAGAYTGTGKLYSKALLKGAGATVPIVGLSILFHVLLKLTRIGEFSPLLYQFFYNFIVLAMAEEIIKFHTLQKFIRRSGHPFTRLDVTMLAAVVGIGFGMLESVIYMIGADVPTVLIRGACLPHAGYGFVTGYFYARGLQENRQGLQWTGFIISWLIHGLYDFSLSDEFTAINDNLYFVALLLAAAEIGLVIKLVSFVRRANKKKEMSDIVVNKPSEDTAVR